MNETRSRARARAQKDRRRRRVGRVTFVPITTIAETPWLFCLFFLYTNEIAFGAFSRRDYQHLRFGERANMASAGRNAIVLVRVEITHRAVGGRRNSRKERNRAIITIIIAPSTGAFYISVSKRRCYTRVKANVNRRVVFVYIAYFCYGKKIY